MQERRRPAEAALGVPVGARVVEVLGDAARGGADVEGQAAVRDLHEVRDLGAVDRQVEEPLLRAGLLVVQLRALGPQPLRQRGRLAPQRFLVRDLGHQAPAHAVRRLPLHEEHAGAEVGEHRALEVEPGQGLDLLVLLVLARERGVLAEVGRREGQPGGAGDVGQRRRGVRVRRQPGHLDTPARLLPDPGGQRTVAERLIGDGRRVHHLHQLEGLGHDGRVHGGDQEVRRVVAILAGDIEPGGVGERARVGRRVGGAQQRARARDDEPAVDHGRGAHRARGRDLAPERLGGLLVLGVENESGKVRGTVGEVGGAVAEPRLDVALEVDVLARCRGDQRLGSARVEADVDRRVGGHDLRRRSAAAAGEQQQDEDGQPAHPSKVGCARADGPADRGG